MTQASVAQTSDKHRSRTGPAREASEKPSNTNEVTNGIPTGWRQRARYRLLRRMIRRPADLVHEDLRIVPLRFMNPKFERRYRKELCATYRVKAPIAAALLCVPTCIFWGLQATSSQFKMSQYPGIQQLNPDVETAFQSVLNTVTGWPLHVMMGLNVLTHLGIGASPWFFGPPHINSEFCIVACMILQQLATAIMVTVIGRKTLPPFDLDNWTLPGLHDAMVLSEEIVSWTYVSVCLLLTIPIVTLNTILPQRTCVSWIVLGAFQIATFACLQVILARFQPVTSATTSTTLAIWNSLVGIICFVGRYQRELQERVDLWCFLKNQLRLKVLHHEVQRLTPPKGVKEVQGESTMEELMALLRQSQRLVGQTSNRVMVPELIHAEEIIKEVLRVLSHGGNLFQVRFDNLPEEGESIIDQYIWGRSFVRSASNATLEARPSSVNLEELSPRRQHALLSRKPLKTRREANDIRKRRDTTTNSMRSPTPLRVGLQAPRHTNSSATSITPPQPWIVQVGELAMNDMTGRVGVDWSMDVLAFEKEHPNILIQFGAYLLLPHIGFLDVPEDRIMQFLAEVQKCYWENPYHNTIHAAEVAHATSCLVKMLDLPSGSAYQNATELVHVVAALGHDVGHPSRNNQFFVNTFDPLAIIYNDVSVLENYHAFLTFQILEYDGCDIFQQLFVDAYRDVRKRIIEIILATDMKEHFESISKFRVRRGATGFDMFTEPEDLWHTVRILVKAADLSHACVDWDQHFEWSCRIQEELYQQGEEEEAMGYPRSPLCDRDLHAGFAKSQKGFLEFVVAPLILEIREADNGGQISLTCLNQLFANKDIWAQMEANGTQLQFPEHILAMSTLPIDLDITDTLYRSMDSKGDGVSEEGELSSVGRRRAYSTSFRDPLPPFLPQTSRLSGDRLLSSDRGKWSGSSRIHQRSYTGEPIGLFAKQDSAVVSYGKLDAYAFTHGSSDEEYLPEADAPLNLKSEDCRQHSVQQDNFAVQVREAPVDPKHRRNVRWQTSNEGVS